MNLAYRYKLDMIAITFTRHGVSHTVTLTLGSAEALGFSPSLLRGGG